MTRSTFLHWRRGDCRGNDAVFTCLNHSSNIDHSPFCASKLTRKLERMAKQFQRGRAAQTSTGVMSGTAIHYWNNLPVEVENMKLINSFNNCFHCPFVASGVNGMYPHHLQVLWPVPCVTGAANELTGKGSLVLSKHHYCCLLFDFPCFRVYPSSFYYTTRMNK